MADRRAGERGDAEGTARAGETGAPAGGPRGLPEFAQGGLRFECTRCGACCRGRGQVELSDEDIERLAVFLELEVEELLRRYTRPIRRGRIRLAEQRSGDCVFFSQAGGCVVHPARPVQCRSYPFWPAALLSAQSWLEETEHCEGIGRGPVVPASEISERLDRARALRPKG